MGRYLARIELVNNDPNAQYSLFIGNEEIRAFEINVFASNTTLDIIYRTIDEMLHDKVRMGHKCPSITNNDIVVIDPTSIVYSETGNMGHYVLHFPGHTWHYNGTHKKSRTNDEKTCMVARIERIANDSDNMYAVFVGNTTLCKFPMTDDRISNSDEVVNLIDNKISVNKLPADIIDILPTTLCRDDVKVPFEGHTIYKSNLDIIAKSPGHLVGGDTVDIIKDIDPERPNPYLCSYSVFINLQFVGRFTMTHSMTAPDVEKLIDDMVLSNATNHGVYNVMSYNFPTALNARVCVGSYHLEIDYRSNASSEDADNVDAKMATIGNFFIS